MSDLGSNTFYKGDLGAIAIAIAPRSQRDVKKMEALRFSYQVRRYIL